MKILVITNLYPPFYIGGYEIGCSNVVKGLRRRGHDVTVLTTPSHVRENTACDSEVPLAQGGHHNEYVFRPLQLRSFQPINSRNEGAGRAFHFEAMISNFTNTSATLDAIRNFSPDCVYLFNLVGLGGVAILDALNFLSIPWALHLMDRVPNTLQSGIPQDVLSVFNAEGGNVYVNGRIISMTKHLIDEIEKLGDFRFTNEVFLIPGWAETENSIMVRKYSDLNRLRFVTAGAVQPHKGIDIILQAAEMLRSSGLYNFQIDIYGDGNVSHYVDVSKQLNVSDHVSFLGSRTQHELMEIYQSSDAFLFPTWEREPFGFAPVEAAAVGCIPIITSTCGVAERLINNVNCIKIERNPKSLFSVLQDFCIGRIDCQKLGDNAQTITRQDLSFESCLNKIEEILQQCAKNSKAQQPSWRNFNLAYLKHNLAYRLYS